MRKCLLVLVFLLPVLLGYGQTCTLSVNLTAPGTVICSGSSVVLTATASGGTSPYTYSWSTGETTSFISVNKPGTYTVTVGDNTSGCPPVSKSITITSTATPAAPTVGDTEVCFNSSITLTATAPGGTYQWFDAPTGGNFLATGASYTTPAITQKTIFYVQTTVNGCTSPRTAVTVYVYNPPVTANAVTCSGTGVTLTATGYTNYNWYDAATGGNQVGAGAAFTTPNLTANTTYYVAGVVNGCITQRSPATVFITSPPAAPTASGVTICSGTSANLQASAPAGNIDWFDVPTGGTSLITSPDFTTPVLTATKTYYVQVTTGCESTRTPVTVTVTQTPPDPTAAPATACPGTSAHLVANAGLGTPEWFARPAGGARLATGSTFDTPPLTIATTYYVQANNGGCVSARIPVTVTISTRPDAPTVAGTLICNGSTATLTASGSTSVYQWYDAATGGTLLASGNTFTTPALTAAKTYYVQAVSAGGCVSTRTAADVTVQPAVAAPSVSGNTICSGDQATLTATGGFNYQWFDAPTGGNKLAEGAVFVSPALTASTTYFVQAISANGCPSPRSAVAIIVNAIPPAPTGTGATICPGSPATISASTPSGTIAWYDAAIGGNLLATGNNFTTPAITKATTYYAETLNNGCVSDTRTAVTVTLITGISPQFQYPSGSVCIGSGNVTPVINNPAGGTFSASPAGLVFVSTTTGEVNVSASLPGTYTISFANNGACPGVTRARFAIGAALNSQFTYNGPFCQSDVNPLPVFPAGSEAGVFSASPAGLVFVDTSTGEIDLEKSAAGTYTVTNTNAASGTCIMSTHSEQVIISARAIVNAGPDRNVNGAATVQLNGTIIGGVTTGRWSGGAGTFSSNTALNPVYTAGPGEVTATLTLTSADPPGICGPVSDVVIIYFKSVPATPTARGQSICPGNSVTLRATAPGGVYSWYDAATGGNLLSTGDSFGTPALNTTTTYYVSTTINGVTSGRRAVTVTVTPLPAAPTANSPTICVGTRATLTVSNAGSGTYEWYSAPSGGNLLAVGTTYTTPELNSDISFYVQAVNGTCASTRTKVDVKVNPYAQIISDSFAEVCSGTALNYTIVSDVPAATFSWSRLAKAGISNPQVTNQTSATITERLINTTGSAIDVDYVIRPSVGTCPGAVFTYTVTVFPSATVTSASNTSICNESASNYTVTFDRTVNNFSWSRAAVAGISNAAVTGQGASTIHEILFNTSNAPVDVVYVITYSIGACSGTFNYTVNVKPSARVISSDKGSACNNVPLPYTIQSNVPSATFTWSRPAVGANPAKNGTGNVISEALVNNTNAPLTVVYLVQPTAFGCSGKPHNYTVTINPTPPLPVINTNSPVCIASSIVLNTPAVANAKYHWSGPNGFTSTAQNPTIPATAAGSGTYSLTLEINGCTGPTATTNVVVAPPPTATAGADKLVCPTVAFIQLAGKIGGGTTTGVWTTSGNGTFSPASNDLNARYIPSAADKTSEAIVLTLTSTSKDDCAAASSNMKITFGLLPAADAGPDQKACSQTGGIQVNAKILAGTRGTWSTSGSGVFRPAANQPNAVYIPSGADVLSKEVKLTFTVAEAGTCYDPADEILVDLVPPPTVDAGGTRYVLRGHQITLTPTVSEENVTYSWSPNVNISSTTIKNPVITGNVDTTYTLVVTDSRGCSTQSSVKIKVSPDLKIQNTFTPNGDGINDTWNIVGLVAYEDAVVDIFNRAGQRLFHSVGYPVPWDGTFNGQQLPAGVYYYVIDTRVIGKLSGWVTVIR